MNENYRETIRHLILDEAQFVRLTLKGTHDNSWRKIVVRPVLIKNRRHLQFSYFDDSKDITKNYRDTEAEQKVDELLGLPFTSLTVQTVTEDVQVTATKQGKVMLHRNPTRQHRLPDLSHDQRKDLPLPADKPDPLLQAIGIMNSQGKVRPEMQGKFAQINEFLKLLEHTGELENLQPPVHILDCGCGLSYLTFAVHHYLNDVLGIPTTVAGIDSSAALIEKSQAHRDTLGLAEVRFYCSAIRDYEPDVPPGIVLALHACDTATDDALALGIRYEAPLILAVPCCHHHLHQQLEAVAPFQPVMRHGILKKRFGDILTDTFRALALRIAGYKTDVVEFISSEHTDRNLMIRAVRRAEPGDLPFVEEYHALKSFWGVTPYIETVLGESFREIVG